MRQRACVSVWIIRWWRCAGVLIRCHPKVMWSMSQSERQLYRCCVHVWSSLILAYVRSEESMLSHVTYPSVAWVPNVVSAVGQGYLSGRIPQASPILSVRFSSELGLDGVAWSGRRRRRVGVGVVVW